MMIFSSVVSSGSSTMMIDDMQYLLYNAFFCLILQIMFSLFYKDIPHHFTHRLDCEYKGNISGSLISKKLLISFFIMGFIEAGFIWVASLEFNSWINIEGKTVNMNTQQSFVFYFLLFSYFIKVLSRFTHLSMLVFMFIIPFIVILVPFNNYVDPIQQLDRFINFPSVFIDFLLVCMASAIVEYIFGRVMMLFIKSVNMRLNYYLEKEERIMYEYLEDSDQDSKIEQTLPYYKDIAVELKEKNLRMLSKTVTGSIERSDSMESVLEEIANSNNKNAINNILRLNERSLRFYDRNKNIEFKNATLPSYIFFLRFILISMCCAMIVMSVYAFIDCPFKYQILPLSTIGVIVPILLASYILAFRKRLQFMVIIATGFLIILAAFFGFLYDTYTMTYVTVYILM